MRTTLSVRRLALLLAVGLGIVGLVAVQPDTDVAARRVTSSLHAPSDGPERVAIPAHHGRIDVARRSADRNAARRFDDIAVALLIGLLALVGIASTPVAPVRRGRAGTVDLLARPLRGPPAPAIA